LQFDEKAFFRYSKPEKRIKYFHDLNTKNNPDERDKSVNEIIFRNIRRI